MRNTLGNVALYTISLLLVSGCESNSVNGYFAPIPSSGSSANSTTGGTINPASPTNPGVIVSPGPGPSMKPTSTPKPTISATASPAPSPSPSHTVVASPSPTPSPSAPCTETCYLNNGVGVTSCGSAQSSCVLTQCNPGYVAENGECVPAPSVTSFRCTEYERLVLDSTNNELTTATGSIIPAQDPSGTGVCYYYPIVELSSPLSG